MESEPPDQPQAEEVRSALINSVLKTCDTLLYYSTQVSVSGALDIEIDGKQLYNVKISHSAAKSGAGDGEITVTEKKAVKKEAADDSAAEDALWNLRQLVPMETETNDDDDNDDNDNDGVIDNGEDDNDSDWAPEKTETTTPARRTSRRTRQSPAAKDVSPPPPTVKCETHSVVLESPKSDFIDELDSKPKEDASNESEFVSIYPDEPVEMMPQVELSKEEQLLFIPDANNESEIVSIYPEEQVVIMPKTKLSKEEELSQVTSKIVKDGDRFKCLHCEQTFTAKGNARAHIRDKHLGIKPHVCFECGKTFRSKSDLSRHEAVHGEKNILCDICDKAFITKSTMRRHRRTVHPHVPDIKKEKVTYQCEFCQRFFKDRYILGNHRLQHTGERPYLCSVCGKGFTTKGSWQGHMNIHTGNKHTCDLCGKSYTTSYILKQHMKRDHKEKANYACDKCDKVFLTETWLQKHKCVDPSYKRFTCDMCEKGFNRKADYDRHMKYHLGIKDFVCEECGKAFVESQHLRVHMMIHTGEKPHVCPHCSKSFMTPSQLKSHVKSHTGEHRTMCDICGQSLALKSVEGHMKLHTGENTYQCEFCAKTFITKTGYKTHVINEHGKGIVEEHKCPHCEKTYKSKDSLRTHIRSHQLQPTKCKYCSKQYKNPTQLKYHMLNQHGANIGTHACTKCGRTFLHYAGLYRHKCIDKSLPKVERERKFQCDECPKRFVRNNQLTRHKKIHLTQKPIICELCGQGFTEQGGLNKHMACRHSDKRPYQCQKCHKRFPLTQSLRNHEKTHHPKIKILYTCEICNAVLTSVTGFKSHMKAHGEKTIKCSYCDKVFNQINLCKSHERIHTGYKPYKCTYCPRAYSFHSSLRHHMLGHTGEYPYKCDQCTKAFRSSSALKIHVKNHDKPQVDKKKDSYPAKAKKSKRKQAQESSGQIELRRLAPNIGIDQNVGEGPDDIGVDIGEVFSYEVVDYGTEVEQQIAINFIPDVQ